MFKNITTSILATALTLGLAAEANAARGARAVVGKGSMKRQVTANVRLAVKNSWGKLPAQVYVSGQRGSAKGSDFNARIEGTWSGKKAIYQGKALRNGDFSGRDITSRILAQAARKAPGKSFRLRANAMFDGSGNIALRSGNKTYTAILSERGSVLKVQAAPNGPNVSN